MHGCSEYGPHRHFHRHLRHHAFPAFLAFVAKHGSSMWGDDASGQAHSDVDHSDLVLSLLEEKALAGLEIASALEAKLGRPAGGPETLYPVLQMLEDMGAVTAGQQEGRKVFGLTEEGRRRVSERREEIARGWESARNDLGEAARELVGEIKELLIGAVKAFKAGNLDAGRVRRIREALRAARKELQAG